MLDEDDIKEWKDVGTELQCRVKNIFRPLFLLYMLIFIICSPIGIWLEICNGNIQSIINAFITYTIAIIAALITDYILIESYDNLTRILGMLGLLILVISMVTLFLSSNNKSILLSIIGCILTLTVWSLSYSSDKKFGKKRKPDTATGGENSTVAGLKGFGK